MDPIWDVPERQLLGAGKAACAHAVSGTATRRQIQPEICLQIWPARGEDAELGAARVPRPALCAWDSSDTVRAVTERALLVGRRATVHASVIVQGFFLGFCCCSVSMQFKCGGSG